MTAPLLTTKLYIPPIRTALVSRGRLIEKLEAGSGGKLTLISAPAGFGKTILISDWIKQSDLPFCWISLDDNDNDPGRFLAYLAASLGSIEIEIDPEPIKLLQNPGQGQIETILNDMINQIADANLQFAVVLDDYHYIQNEEVHQILSYLLEHFPPKAHMVIATRADPPLPVPLLRARGELTELRSTDLRFQLYEGGEFLNTVFELGLQPDDVEKLVSRTDGWVAGLQLASIALRGHQNPGEYIQRFSGSQDYIVDFLTDEVLEGQPEEIQEFLLKTAILKRLNAPLSEAVSGAENCANKLKELRTNNLFLRALDDQHQWFAYHRLFRDLLTQKLFEKYPDDVSDLFLKASQWCQENGLMNDAIDYALQGRHLDRAADLIESQAQRIIQQSEIVTFVRWIEKLPESRVRERPNLCIYYAWVLLISNRKPETAAHFLDQVHPNDDGTLGKLNAVRSVQVAFQRQIPKSIELAQQALQQLPEDDYSFRQIAGWNLSAALFLSGEQDAGTAILQDVANLSLASGNHMVAIVTLCRLGNIRGQQGDLFQAYDYYHQALEIASKERVKPLPAACEALLGLGKIEWEWYQLDTAADKLSAGLELSKRWRETASVDGHITLAHLRLSQGDVDGANRVMVALKEIASKKIYTETGKQYVDLQEVYLQLRQGNLAFARVWAERHGLEAYVWVEDLEVSRNSGAELIRNLGLLVYTRVLLAEKHYPDASALLRKLLPAILKSGHQAQIIETHLLLGITQDALGYTKNAVKSISAALELAAPANFLRMFLEEGDGVIRLLRQIQAQGDSSNFIDEILASSGKTKHQTSPEGLSRELRIPLSDREVEILHLLVSERSVPEIAANMHISVSTLRTHIRNIYRKLDTHSRFEAVSKAKDWKII